MSVKRMIVSLGALLALVLSLFLSASLPVAAQTATVPDLSQFGYPQVGGSVTFTPGTAATVTAGNQQVVLPSDFISKTVKFELLTGDPSFFAPLLTGDDAGRPVQAAFAFRVTDVSTNNLIGRFDKPVQWSITDPSIGPGSEVYNTSAANPPVITANSAPGTVQGNTLSHPFGGAGVGWLVLGPEAAASPTAAAAPTSAPVPTVAVAPTTAPEATAVPVVAPVGMPATGNPSPDNGALPALAGLALLLCCVGGVVAARGRAVHK